MPIHSIIDYENLPENAFNNNITGLIFNIYKFSPGNSFPLLSVQKRTTILVFFGADFSFEALKQVINAPKYEHGRLRVEKQ